MANIKNKTNKPKRVGRPFVDDDQAKHRINVTIRPDQADKFKNLGGSKWLRRKIDEDKVEK